MALQTSEILLSLVYEVGDVSDCGGELGVPIRVLGFDMKHLPAAQEG